MYCMLAFNTLARPEALLELQRFQVDFDNRVIDLKYHPAGTKRRNIARWYQLPTPSSPGFAIAPQEALLLATSFTGAASLSRA